LLHQTFFPEAEKPLPGYDQMIMDEDLNHLREFLDRFGQADVGFRWLCMARRMVVNEDNRTSTG